MVLDYPDFQNPVRAGDFTLAGQGATLIAVTGTAIALRAATTIQQVMLRARTLNVGIVYVGSSTVTNNETAGTGGLQLSPGDYVVFPESDLAHIFVNGAAGDGVSYMFWT